MKKKYYVLLLLKFNKDNEKLELHFNLFNANCLEVFYAKMKAAKVFISNLRQINS